MADNPLEQIQKVIQTITTTTSSASQPSTSTTASASSSNSVFDNGGDYTSSIYGTYDSASDTIFDEEGYKKRKEEHKKYFDSQKHTTIVNVDASYSNADIMRELNAAGKQRNEQQEHILHGGSEEAYDAFQEFMAEVYEIETDSAYHESVAVSMAMSISHDSRFREMEKEAASFDSVLDLVLVEKFQNFIQEHYNGKIPNWDKLVDNSALRQAGMMLVQTADRQYSLALIDEKGNIIQDEEGNMGQVFLSDYLMPDGLAQNNEIRVAEMLDFMGFDCLSALDYSKEEYELIKKMAELDSSQLGTSSGMHYSNTVKIKEEVVGSFDKTTKRWTKAKEQDRSAWMNGTYVDVVTGDVTGAKKYEKLFTDRRDKSTYFRDKRKCLGKGGYTGVASGTSKGGAAGSGASGGTSGLGNTDNRTPYSEIVEIEYSPSSSIVDVEYSNTDNNKTSEESQTISAKSVTMSEFSRIVEKTAKEEHCSQEVAVDIAMKKYNVISYNKNGVKEYFKRKLKAESAA